MRKRVFAAFAVLVFLNTAWAGTRRSVNTDKKMSDGFGVTFGYVSSSYRTTDWATDEIEKTPALNGFAVSVTKDIALIRKYLYFQTGLGYIYQTRSRDISVDAFPASIVSDRKEHLIAVPLRLKYTLPVTDKIAVTADAGPVLFAGLSSKMVFRANVQDGIAAAVSYDVYGGQFDSPEVSAAGVLESWAREGSFIPYGKVKRFDVLLGAGMGAVFFRVLEVRAGYDWGLVNRYGGEIAADKKMYRGQFTLGFGLRF